MKTLDFHLIHALELSRLDKLQVISDINHNSCNNLLFFFSNVSGNNADCRGLYLDVSALGMPSKGEALHKTSKGLKIRSDAMAGLMNALCFDLYFY